MLLTQVTRAGTTCCPAGMLPSTKMRTGVCVCRDMRVVTMTVSKGRATWSHTCTQNKARLKQTGIQHQETGARDESEKQWVLSHYRASRTELSLVTAMCCCRCRPHSLKCEQTEFNEL